MRSPGFVLKLLFFLGGLLIWGSHFLFVYGFNGIACARGFDRNAVFGIGIVPLTVAVVTVLAMAASILIVGLAVAGRGPGITHECDQALQQFWRLGTAVVASFSTIAVAWTGLPALIIPPCG
jgi:hypothetical protein